MYLSPARSYPQKQGGQRSGAAAPRRAQFWSIQAEAEGECKAQNIGRATVRLKPGRAAAGASQHEHEPAAITYSGIFSPYR